MTKFTQGKWYWQKNILLSPEKIILGAMLLPPLPANARLIAAAPEMYELIKNTAEYIFECQKLYKPFPNELVTYAERMRELIAHIDGEEDNNENNLQQNTM